MAETKTTKATATATATKRGQTVSYANHEYTLWSNETDGRPVFADPAKKVVGRPTSATKVGDTILSAKQGHPEVTVTEIKPVKGGTGYFAGKVRVYRRADGHK